MEKRLDHIIEALRAGERSGRSCSLLIGAGCSVSAGIPTADGFVKLIQQHHPAAYADADKKTYAGCMAKLDTGARRDLIVAQINAAKINWAHVAIAQLIANGYVDRVLTTNFDPLVARACALVGQFPAVYDFAASTTFEPAAVAEKAVFHLHGQGTGFVLMNTEQECKEHCRRLGPLFQDAGRGRSWIVVGYSGDNDPVFSHLAAVTRFEYGLYWVGYLDAEPSRALREHLLIDGKQAYFVEGHDADSFFVELAQKLDCFPPEFIERPFTHLLRMFEAFSPFRLPSFTSDAADVLDKPRRLLDRAITDFEPRDAEASIFETAEAAPQTQDALVLTAGSLLMAGKYGQVQAAAEGLDEDARESMASTLAWSFLGEANELARRAKAAGGEEAEALFREAAEKYAEAVRLKPDLHDAFERWGNTLVAWAQNKEPHAATNLLREAGDKYVRAAQLKCSYEETFEEFCKWAERVLGE
jgi:hypothetical protein